EEGLAICREIGDRWFVSYFLWIVASSAAESGDIVAARAYAEESLTIARELEGPLLIVCALDAIAAVARAEGDDEAAERHLAEAVEIGRTTIVRHPYVASARPALGGAAGARGRLAEGAAHRGRRGAPRPPWRRSTRQSTAEQARSTLGEARYEANALHGSRLSLEEAAAFAARAP